MWWAMASVDVVRAFEQLAVKYSWTDQVRDFMTSASGLAATHVDHFIYAVSAEAEIKDFVDAIGISDAAVKLQQISRIRRAWVELRKAQKDADLLKARGRDDVDMDQLLTQQELDDAADKFYRRYKISYPPAIMPSDQLISRVSKEVSKRALSMRDLWKNKSQAQMLKATRKRTALTDGVDLLSAEPEDDGHEPHTLHVYLSKLFMQLLAHTVVGTVAVSTAPTSEPRGSDTTDFVEFPLDLAFRYYYRAQRYATRVSQLRLPALEYLQQRDESEREAWIEYFRNGATTLGKVVLRVYEMREGMWQPPEQPARSLKDAAKEEDPNTPERKRRKGKGKGERQESTPPPPTPKGKVVMDFTLRDGTKLCSQYQHGKCKSKESCDQGKHLCAARLRSGRVCGLRHPGSKCLNKQRVSR